VYVISDADRGRIFGGVGAISGGGATSRLLFDYPEATRSVLLDLLFKPQYGAAFQNVKVEIPGDADTTCGAEQAHRHDAADGGSCTRGYEGWFLSEANQRRPGLAVSSLQWAAPRFVGEEDVDSGKSLFTWTNIDSFVLPWVACMKEAYNVSVTHLGGGWNERPFNASYIKLLRQTLDASPFAATGIAAADDCCGSNWNIVHAMLADATLAASVDVISTHVAGILEENTPTPSTLNTTYNGCYVVFTVYATSPMHAQGNVCTKT
jgi:Glycosyl hydrolase family 59